MASARPGVTVVVAAYNAGRFLEECCGSVAAQTAIDWHCIVVDDGSTDGSIDALPLLKHPSFEVVRQANRGVSAARNRGLALACTPYVLFLDADDRLHPSALTRLARRLDEDGRAVASYGTFVKILEDGAVAPQQKPLHRHRYPSGDVLRAMLTHNFLANGGHVLLRAEAARSIGGFDERLRLSEDWEFWCRLSARGAFSFIGREPEVFNLRLRRESSSSRAIRWPEHAASIDAVRGNPILRERFSAREWTRIVAGMTAGHLWEAGRQNFRRRRFAEANRLMVRSMMKAPTAKRLVIFALAQLSRACGRPLTESIRFIDRDYPAGPGGPPSRC